MEPFITFSIFSKCKCKSYIIRQNDKIIDRILLILNRKKNIDIKISKHSQSLDKTKESFNILDVYKKLT